ncbi:hypothetical protein OVA29_11120 [Exiguobacterium sp. SL14]|nr:hypothetical protein [Exiguobacterium sp. SL14]MCY1691163.1 hypothetical protein [Exiguobacterium sp. SL14]
MSEKRRRIIENEFAIDRDQSVDKSTLLDTTEFGYLSVHFVASLSEQRLALSEYGRFKDYTAEIQIRSILQHAWAEIEHDLGYKNPNSVPAEVKRAPLVGWQDCLRLPIRNSSTSKNN